MSLLGTDVCDHLSKRRRWDIMQKVTGTAWAGHLVVTQGELTMPIYEYECEQCGVRFEKSQRFVDPVLTECPECSGHVHRVMQPVGIIFKGSGFYATDHHSASGSTPRASKKEESKPDTTSKTETTSTSSE